MFIKIINGSIEIGATVILEEINFEVKKKDRIAIVGRNGAGKTTLLQALMDASILESGVGEEKFQYIKSGNPTIGYLKQNQKLDENKTLLDEILDVYKDILNVERKLNMLEEDMQKGSSDALYKYEEEKKKFEDMGGYKYKKEYTIALKKFGFSMDQYDKKIERFSGGEKTKIAFLKMLLSKPDILILDEPTNHLDISAIEWLEDYLMGYPNAFVLVSHDRMFIDHVATTIYEIEYGKTEVYKGNYSFYEKEKKKRYEKLLKDYEYQQKEIKRLQSIADRFRYKPSKASMAMSKLHAIDRMKKIDKPLKANTKVFKFQNSNILESGKKVLTVRDLKIGYQTVLSQVSFEMIKKDRLGVIGKNGTGKSTLLKTIVGLIPSLGGSIELGTNVSIGYFDQSLNLLNENLSVYEEFKEKFPALNNFEIRAALATFMFKEEDIDKKVSVLSGGEKVLLQLLEIMYKKPNFLVLDEPTNHLDIISKERLESILNDYEGTILFVSHDRYFVKSIANSILSFDEDGEHYYPLTYEEYMEKKSKTPEAILNVGVPQKETIKKDNREQGKTIRRLENMIDKREQKLKELKNSLFDESIYSDVTKSKETESKIKELENEISELISEWEEAQKR